MNIKVGPLNVIPDNVINWIFLSLLDGLGSPARGEASLYNEKGNLVNIIICLL